jgi:hypothetical protein
MKNPPSLPVAPLEHVSMDFARLRDEGLRLLGKLTGELWTDYNTHDPGITILEQLCYALTDLGYRIAYPMSELLGPRAVALPGPELILTTDPVTSGDLTRLVLDVDGIENAWVEQLETPELPFYYHAGSRELRLRVDPAEPDAAPVRLRGLERIVLQSTESVPAATAIRAVATKVHAARALCTDFDTGSLQPFFVTMAAKIEVDRVDSPAALVAEIIERVAAYLAPKARFVRRDDAVDQRSNDDVFDGPLLSHGVIDVLPETRETIYVSDLLHVILDVPGVKAVRSLVLRGTSGVDERWAVDVPAGHMAVLAPASLIELFRRDLPLHVDVARVRAAQDSRREPHAASLATGARVQPWLGRSLTRFHSIQYQFPAIYGIGPLGLPRSASPDRHAQARQLAVYLLIFDQLFANSLHQLAHAAELLSAEEGTTNTYFTAPLDDERLDLDALRAQTPQAHREWLERAIDTGTSLDRRKRFLAHLLARYGDELGDHALLEASANVDTMIIADRRAFLRDYPRLSAGRGSGYDILHPETAAGFETRLRHKLGLREGARLHVIEHILLRPVGEDRKQIAAEGEPEVPLLADVAGPDPWSLHISVVLPEAELRNASFEQFVEQTITAETPAHITVHLHWFGSADGVDHWQQLHRTWDEFREAHRAYRLMKLAGQPVAAEVQLPFRDARDRMIDLLHLSDDPNQLDQKLGRTYPLRDVPLPEQIVVTPGSRAKIELGYSQPGVTYELRLADGSRVLDAGNPIRVVGTGGSVELVTPPINVDTSFRVLAIKPSGREAWLRAVVRVLEGVDRAVVAQIAGLPLLDARIDSAPKPTDARLGHWAVEAQVEVLESQEGVTYQIIQNAEPEDLKDPSKDVVLSQNVVVGTSGTIVLRTKPIKEDIDLRVRGTKITGTPANPIVRTAVLDVVMPLRVRANRAAGAQLNPAVVPFGGSSTLRIGTTQTSAFYQLYRGRIRDLHFVFGGDPWNRPTITVNADGRNVVLVRPLRPAHAWEDIQGFGAVADRVIGTGAPLDLPIAAPATDDTYFLVKASKRHESGPLGTDSEVIESHVQLDDAVALLVRPDAAPALKLSATLIADAITALEVDAGQAGVFYELRIAATPALISVPAYFHQRDDLDARVNKGLALRPDLLPPLLPPPTDNALRVEVDFVLVRDGAVGLPATTAPPIPVVTVEPPVAANSVVAVRARKAMSGVAVDLAKQAIFASVPAVKAQPAQVTAGQSAMIVIETSTSGDSYWLERDSNRVGNVIAGTGARIELPTGAIDRRTVFYVVAMRVDQTKLYVERQVQIAVDVA